MDGNAPDFAAASHAALADPQLRGNFRRAMDGLMSKRAAQFADAGEWTGVRALAALVRLRALSKLPELLEKLEETCTRNGITVHWAATTEEANAIDWRNPRLICVASGFTKYDEHAVQQINRSIELVRYRDFSGELLALELVTTTKVDSSDASAAPAPKGSTSSASSKTVTEYLEQAPTAPAAPFSLCDAASMRLGSPLQISSRQDRACLANICSTSTSSALSPIVCFPR